MLKILLAKPLKDYKLWVQYSDGVDGEVDLSHLVGKGVFWAWQDQVVFQNFKIENGRSISWSEEIDLCADALYLEITGKVPEEPIGKITETALLSEKALTEDWNRQGEDDAWLHLQSDQ